MTDTKPDFWTWAETHPVGRPSRCLPPWSQKDRRWFQDSYKALSGLDFFKELPDGRLVSWDYGEKKMKRTIKLQCPNCDTKNQSKFSALSSGKIYCSKCDSQLSNPIFERLVEEGISIGIARMDRRRESPYHETYYKE